MKTSKSLSVKIEKPCTVDLDKMDKTDCGRMCSVCEINVYDFSKKTTPEIIDILQKEPVVCGQFHKRHISTDRKFYKTLNKIEAFFLKIRLPKVAIGLIGVIMFLSSCIKHQVAGAYVQEAPEKDSSCDHIKKGKFTNTNK